VRGIGGEQCVQQSRACARKADDEKWRANFFARDFRKRFAIALDQKAIAKLLGEIGAHGIFANEIKTGLAMAGIEQTRERLDEIAFAEILKAAPSFRCLEERGSLAVASDGPIEEHTAAIQRTDEKRESNLGDGR
jgi:hypothetical protein